LDGCGGPLIAAISLFEDPRYYTQLPANLRAYKHWNAGTMLFQQHDSCRGHSGFKSNVKTEKDILVEGEEVKLPHYMPAVHQILVKTKFKAPLYRTVYKMMANIEVWALSSMNKHNLDVGYKITGWVPWNLFAFLQRWAGWKSLTESDLQKIADVFPALEAVADLHGVIHKEFAVEILGDFLREVQKEGLSRLALAHLAAQELLKPAYLRPLSEWPACILDNTGLLRGRRERWEAKEELRAQAEAEAVQFTFVQVFQLVAGVCIPLSVQRVLKGLKQGSFREQIYGLRKFLDEADYLSLRGATKSLWKTLPINKRFAPKTTKLNAADKRTTAAALATTAALEMLGVVEAALQEEGQAQEIALAAERNVGVDMEEEGEE
jgi:hypothetical protein